MTLELVIPCRGQSIHSIYICSAYFNSIWRCFCISQSCAYLCAQPDTHLSSHHHDQHHKPCHHVDRRIVVVAWAANALLFALFFLADMKHDPITYTRVNF